MLIHDAEQGEEARVFSLAQLCPYCGHSLGQYPVIQSDDTNHNVYHVPCALQLATELLIDVQEVVGPPPHLEVKV